MGVLGGKVEPGETPEEALIREIKEELDTEISVGKYIHTVEYDYSTFHLSMRCYICKAVSGKLLLKEHEAASGLQKTICIQWIGSQQIKS